MATETAQVQINDVAAVDTQPTELAAAISTPPARPSALIGLLRQLVVYTANDDRPVLEHVAVEWAEDDQLHFVAADGYRLIVVSIPGDIEESVLRPRNRTMLFHAPRLRSLARRLSNAQTLSYLRPRARFDFTARTMTIEGMQKDLPCVVADDRVGHFPAWRPLMPDYEGPTHSLPSHCTAATPCGGRLGLNPAFLRDIANSAKLLMNPYTFWFESFGPKAPIEFRFTLAGWEQAEPVVRILCMPIITAP